MNQVLKKTVKIFLALASLAIMFAGCKKAEPAQEVSEYDDDECTCPHTTICLQPFDDFTQAEARKLKRDIIKHREEFGHGDITDIKILPNRQLTENMMNDSMTRFRAERIVHAVETDPKKHITTIALTHKDISTTHNGKKDWGVIGLAFRPGTGCVISTYRMQKKSDFWKAAAHEFMHAFYGAPHCRKNDPHCILQDARGKYTFNRSPSLCDYCKQCY